MKKVPTDGRVISRMDGWDVGLVSTFDPERLPPTALTRARNLTIEYGSARKRNGTAKHNSVGLDTALPIQSLYWTEGVLGDFLVVTSGAKIINLTSGTQVDIYTGLTSGQKYGFVEARKDGTNYLYCYAEGQAPLRWSGAGSASLVTGPVVNCSFVVNHRKRLWAARSTDPNLYISDPLDPETWEARNSLRILEPQDGSWTGLVSRRRDLVCFSEGSVWIVDGENPEPPAVDLSVNKTTGQRAGAISRDAIAVDDKTDAIYFVSFDGYVYALEGYEKKPLSQQIKTLFDAVNTSALGKVAMIVMDDLLFVSVPYGPAQTTNNRIFVSHLRKPHLPWVEYTGINALAFAKRRLTKSLYIADSLREYLLYYDPTLYADEGAAIDYDLITAPIHSGNYYSRKRVIHAHLQCDVVASGTFTVSSGPNEIDPDSFTAAPVGAISTSETGVIAGDLRDGESVARNGVVSYPINLNADADEDRGEWFRIRVRANTAYDFNLRRMIVSEAHDPPPVGA